MNSRLALAMSTVALSITASGFPAVAAEWNVTPKISEQAEYVDNPLLAASNSALYYPGNLDFTSDLSATAALPGDHYDLSAAPRLQFIDYVSQSSLNQNNQYLNLAGDFKTERTTWSAAANGTRDNTLTSEAGVTGLTTSNRRHDGLVMTAGPSFQYTERTSFSAQAGWQDNHYENADNTGLVDYRYASGDLKGVYLLTELSNLSLDLSGAQLSAPAAQNRSNSYGAILSLTSRLDERWTATLSAGPSLVEASGNTDEGALYDVQLQRQGELAHLSAEVSRSITPTGRGVLSTRDALALTASLPMTERLSFDLSGLLSRTRDIESSTASTNYAVSYYDLQGTLRWQMAPTWSLTTMVDDQHQMTTVTPNPGELARGYRVSVGLVWTGLPQRL